jgi:hypothetical protein
VSRQLTRDNFVSVRFSTEEKEHLLELAAERNQTLSELVRTVTLGMTGLSRQKILPEVNRRLYFQLGEALEQLAAAACEGNAEGIYQLQRLLNEVRGVLLGIPFTDTPQSERPSP